MINTDTDTESADAEHETDQEVDQTAERRGARTQSGLQLVEQAVHREAPSLLAYLTRRVNNPADAADLLGDVLVIVWRRIEAMPPEPDQARMWMFGIARKVLAGNHRTQHRRQALTDRLRHELATTAGGVVDEDQADADPRAEHLAKALNRLRPNDQEILSLIHWESFTLVETARHLHLRPTTARSRYHRARKRLKQLLESD